ncbi:hypothetical protein SISSUDRAFT_1067626 [Sistotremastrum suecicum HHB10207 ss-3]|uniref:Uncharacterized protein n=1 Tax=Sistotremastrum suecicum HHB10207 ss-3 TaxID=1314776 RepID=A0A165WX43_9AGAM|nr:hypothetical protein SISSUDRAFT_1067626 [Sistotremastrum suecicum HHB10207 ss-3]
MPTNLAGVISAVPLAHKARTDTHLSPGLMEGHPSSHLHPLSHLQANQPTGFNPAPVAVPLEVTILLEVVFGDGIIFQELLFSTDLPPLLRPNAAGQWTVGLDAVMHVIYAHVTDPQFQTAMHFAVRTALESEFGLNTARRLHSARVLTSRAWGTDFGRAHIPSSFPHTETVDRQLVARDPLAAGSGRWILTAVRPQAGTDQQALPDNIDPSTTFVIRFLFEYDLPPQPNQLPISYSQNTPIPHPDAPSPRMPTLASSSSLSSHPPSSHHPSNARSHHTQTPTSFSSSSAGSGLHQMFPPASAHSSNQGQYRPASSLPVRYSGPAIVEKVSRPPERPSSRWQGSHLSVETSQRLASSVHTNLSSPSEQNDDLRPLMTGAQGAQFYQDFQETLAAQGNNSEQYPFGAALPDGDFITPTTPGQHLYDSSTHGYQHSPQPGPSSQPLFQSPQPRPSPSPSQQHAQPSFTTFPGSYTVPPHLNPLATSSPVQSHSSQQAPATLPFYASSSRPSHRSLLVEDISERERYWQGIAAQHPDCPYPTFAPEGDFANYPSTPHIQGCVKFIFTIRSVSAEQEIRARYDDRTKALAWDYDTGRDSAADTLSFVVNATHFRFLIAVFNQIGFCAFYGPLPMDSQVHEIVHWLHPLSALQGSPYQGHLQFRLIYRYFNWHWVEYSRHCDIEVWADKVIQSTWPVNKPREYNSPTPSE